MDMIEELPTELQDVIDQLEADRLAKIEVIGKAVAKKRDEAIKGRKQSGIETIWEEDEEYYQGIDDANRDSHPWVKSASSTGGISRTPNKSPTRCSSFFNITRQFVDSASARMGDILLPSGDWNFAVKPTPVQDDAQMGLVNQVSANSPQPIDPNAPDPRQADAEKKAEKGELWIQDKLVECSYHTEVRKVIEDAAKLGTGILKGPFPEKHTTKKATRSDKGTTLELLTTVSPVSRHVDPWDFFPDPACGDDIHNGSYTCERDRLTPKALKKLKGTDGYLSEQIDKILAEGPGKRNLSDGYSRDKDSDNDDELFEVWYFYGEVEVDDLKSMKVDVSGEDSAKKTLPAIVTLVNDTPIKAFINPMDDGSFPYDVMVWQRCVGTWTGIGVARQGRTAQDQLNAAMRNMMDNAGLAGGPMIIIRKGAIEPANGIWEVTARKVWYSTAEADVRSVADAFTAIDIPMVQVELSAIVQMAYKLMEDSTGIFLIMQGQQGSAPDTVGGMELLHRNASAILRRIARIFDERVTEPHIRRYYDWLLLYGPNDAKGDMKIEAIGSTALVEREIQAMEAMALLQMSLNPAFGLDPEKAAIEVLKAKRMIPDKWTMDEAKKKSLPVPTIPAIEVAKIRAASEDKRFALEKDKTVAANRLLVHKTDVDIDRDRAYVEAMAERDTTNAQQRMAELQVKRELAMLDYSNKHGIALNEIKAKLAETAMKLKTQRELAGLAQVTTPPTEPPQHAVDGHAFEQ